MFDLTALGAQLVKELSELIEQSIIVTDQHGVIIASTDRSRLNTIHEGATLAMETRQELPMTEEMTGKLHGVRPGVVLPIIVTDIPIGVIGITGKPLEIEKYAKLVRKVAELFVTEFMARQEHERGFRDLELLIFDLFTTDMDEIAMVERSKLLGLDITAFSRVAVIESNKAFDFTEVEDLLRTQRIHPNLKLVRWGVGKLIMLVPENAETQLRTKLGEFEQLVKSYRSDSIGIGVGAAKPYTHLKESFQEAERAAAVSRNWKRIVFEEELKLELLYHSLPNEVKEEYRRRTIEPLLGDEELVQTLKVWLKNTGSLQEIANELHIHKNTLKYRVQKIEEILNLNFDNKEHIAIVAVAIGLLAAK
ncbi:CdaR family transcriptional regulator [Chungangia koreensis]|uniref:CdaR family transcriptional regulator n=1 Tax=Chungangia koreensis TaxID=752657 RepID=A0ABV8WZL3_9LACT